MTTVRDERFLCIEVEMHGSIDRYTMVEYIDVVKSMKAFLYQGPHIKVLVKGSVSF